MKIHKDAKIELVASNNRARYSIGEPFLDTSEAGAPLIIATNGKAMATFPVELQDGDAQGYVSAEVLKAARKQAGRLETAIVGLNGVASFPNGGTMPRDGKAKDGQFPNWRAVQPCFDGEKTVRVAFDAELLADLASAMGTRGVILTFALPPDGKAAEGAIKVSPCSVGNGDRFADARANGLLMPVRVE